MHKNKKMLGIKIINNISYIKNEVVYEYVLHKL